MRRTLAGYRILHSSLLLAFYEAPLCVAGWEVIRFFCRWYILAVFGNARSIEGDSPLAELHPTIDCGHGHQYGNDDANCFHNRLLFRLNLFVFVYFPLNFLALLPCEINPSTQAGSILVFVYRLEFLKFLWVGNRGYCRIVGTTFTYRAVCETLVGICDFLGMFNDKLFHILAAIISINLLPFIIRHEGCHAIYTFSGIAILASCLSLSECSCYDECD
nr:MAG TPA: hypothetical protein [Caudoviricetes sp.]